MGTDNDNNDIINSNSDIELTSISDANNNNNNKDNNKQPITTNNQQTNNQ